MSQIFLKLLNQSIAASWVILAVVILRPFLKKAPKWICCALWALAAIRLVCPFSLESALSLVPSSETIPYDIAMEARPAIDSGIPIVNAAINPVIASSFTPDPLTSVNPLQIVIPAAAVIWIGGMFALLLYALLSFSRLKKSVGASIEIRDNIMACDEVKSPFILGIFKPVIYVPSSMKGETLDYVITHETAHIQRHDHWWKPFGYLLLSVYWYNPLCWLAYVLLCRDIEMACDERVIRDLDGDGKAAYSQALLDCSFSRKRIAACPLAFGEVSVKERVESVLNYRKPAFWIIAAAVAACAAVAVCFLTNPSASVDSLEMIEWPQASNENAAKYRTHFGRQFQGGLVYAEQWSDGACVRSSPVVLTQDVEQIYIRMAQRQVGGASVGTEIQIDTDGNVGALITYFAHPEAKYFSGWAFTAHEKNETVKITPQKDNILAAMVFDNGSGVMIFDCKTYENEPERLQNAEYMIVIRACFANGTTPLGQSETIIGGAEAPDQIAMHASLVSMDGEKMVVEDTEDGNVYYVAWKNVAPSPEPQIGDILQIIYDGILTEEVIDFENHSESEVWIRNPMHISVLADGPEDPAHSGSGLAIGIDGVVYYDTGRQMPVEPDPSVVEYVEIPVGNGSNLKTTAWAKIEGNILAVLIGEEWYEFAAG